jgi:CDP-diacylglycerol--glycerol-3-phosphate 3-phosphatidyltransferase
LGTTQTRHESVIKKCRRFADRTIGGWLARKGVAADAVTLIGAFLVVAGSAIWALYTKIWWTFPLGLFVVVLGAIADWIDGSVARMSKDTTFGVELDTLTDRVMETAMFAAIALVMSGYNWKIFACITALGGSLLVSYARTRAEKLGLKGNVGRGDRLVRLIVLGIGVIAGYWIGLQWALYAINLLAWPTFLQRVLSIRKQLIARGTP